MKTALCITAGIALAAVALADEPVVSDVSVSGEYNRTCTVSYKLTGAAAIIGLSAETNASGDVWLPLDRMAFVGMYGDVNKVVEPSEDVRRIYWPVRGVDRVIPAEKIRVTVKAWKKDAPPDWMLLSLRSEERDLPNFSRLSFYESREEIPNGWTGRCSKVEQIVFRKVPAKNVTWRMGTKGDPKAADNAGIERYHTVTFTNDYYVSIFKVTQGQWSNACHAVGGPDNFLGGYRLQVSGFGGNTQNENIETGDWPVLPCRAVLGYIRGDGFSGNGSINWPATGHAVRPKSLLDVLRTVSGGGLEFDLPTEAQWEYFCRAGTDTTYYDGSGQGLEIAWLNENAGGVYQEVGTRKPNAWGLFDLAGNGNEWCLDVYDAAAEDSTLWGDGVVDPQGPSVEIELNPQYGYDMVYRSTRGANVVWSRLYGLHTSAARYKQRVIYAACTRLVVPAEIP